MTDLTNLEQMAHEAWSYARQALQFSWMAQKHVTLTMHEVQRAHHRASMAWLALSMPKADAWTLSITTTILAQNGLLDEKPAIRPSARGTRRSAMTTWPATARRR